MENEIVDTKSSKCSKCFICKCESNDPNFDLSAIRFKYLEGEPFICELCLVRAFGIEGTWKEEIASKIKEKVL